MYLPAVDALLNSGTTLRFRLLGLFDFFMKIFRLNHICRGSVSFTQINVTLAYILNDHQYTNTSTASLESSDAYWFHNAKGAELHCRLVSVYCLMLQKQKLPAAQRAALAGSRLFRPNTSRARDRTRQTDKLTLMVGVTLPGRDLPSRSLRVLLSPATGGWSCSWCLSSWRGRRTEGGRDVHWPHSQLVLY